MPATKIIVYTLVSPDGVIGLNGKQWLLDDDGELMKFDTLTDAKDFIEDAGEDPEDEWIGYQELEQEEKQ